MLIINNAHNNAHVNKQPPQQVPLSSLPEWQQKLHELMQFHIDHESPKLLGRALRDYFLLQVASLKTVNADWEEKVLHFIAMLELIDDVGRLRIEIISFMLTFTLSHYNNK